MTIKGYAHNGNHSQKIWGNVPNLDCIGDNWINDELLEDNPNCYENGNDRDHGNILQRIHS